MWQHVALGRLWGVWSLVLLGLLAGASRPAMAGCGVGDRFFFAPPSKTSLPGQPTIRLFVRKDSAKDVQDQVRPAMRDREGNVVAFDQVEEPSTTAFRAFRLRPATARTRLTVVVRIGDEEASATYPVGKPARKPIQDGDPGSGRIVSAQYEFEQGCPPTAGFVFTVRPKAPAYRVTLGNANFVVPDQPGKPQTTSGTLLAGTHGCRDFSLPEQDALVMEVTPLFADGSEGVVRPGACHTDADGTTHCIERSETRTYPRPKIRFGGPLRTEGQR